MGSRLGLPTIEHPGEDIETAVLSVAALAKWYKRLRMTFEYNNMIPSWRGDTAQLSHVGEDGVRRDIDIDVDVPDLECWTHKSAKWMRDCLEDREGKDPCIRGVIHAAKAIVVAVNCTPQRTKRG